MIDLSDEDFTKLIELTKGYSVADLKALSTEAAMMPLRELIDVSNCDIAAIRTLKVADFVEALKNVRMSVNQQDLKRYFDWNEMNGSFAIKEKDLND